MEVVAQLVRASVCGTEGRGFEPHLPPNKKGVLKLDSFFFTFNYLLMNIMNPKNTSGEL